MRSPLKTHGGKGYLAPWIVSMFPPREEWMFYREPFFGGGAVLFQIDPEGIGEAVNDLDGELINFWNVLKDESDFRLLQRYLEVTPFSEDLFNAPWVLTPQGYTPEVLRAGVFFIRCRMSRQGLKKDFATPTKRIRRGMDENVSAWLSAIEGLPEIHARLKRVQIRNMDALDFIKTYDNSQVIHYCDPPYLPETRVATDAYGNFEMSLEDHQNLLDILTEIQGKFVLSGYPSEMYTEHARKHGWRIETKQIDNKASAKKTKDKKTEVLYLNY